MRIYLTKIDSSDRDAALRVLFMAFEREIRVMSISDATQVWASVGADGQVLGVIAANKHPEAPWMVLEGIAVMPGNPGIGKRLLNRLSRACKLDGLEQIITYAATWNGPSIGLLLKAGYRITDHQWQGRDWVHFVRML